LYDFNGVIIEEESVDVLERDQVVDVAKSIVLQMQRFIELLALETLLILETDDKIGLSHVNVIVLIFLAGFALHLMRLKFKKI